MNSFLLQIFIEAESVLVAGVGAVGEGYGREGNSVLKYRSK